MNFILDIGNVLIDFKPIPFLQGLFPEQALADKVNNIIFKSPEWLQMDEGIVSHKDACTIFCKREPNFAQAITHTIGQLNTMLTPISDTIKLLPKIKERGHKLYYLSNYHNELRDYILGKHPFFSLFDGGVFSCDVNAVKPNPKIYRLLLEKYNLTAEECIFFDDMEENIAAAKKEGISSVLFTSADCIKPFL
ncbi:MAG: HAD family phosphatase [Defluviitaleaceae bacterium]|nr:HAD family phosphatase [Defluviitaleaceae bacterium]